MLPSLASLLPWASGAPPAGATVVISDALKDGTLFVHHFVSAQLKQADQTVILVSFTQLLSHYTAAAKKITTSAPVNLAQAVEQGRLVFLNAADILIGQTTSSDGDFSSALREIVGKIGQAIPSERSYSVIVDELSLPFALGCSKADYAAFVTAVKSTAISADPQTVGVLPLVSLHVYPTNCFS